MAAPTFVAAADSSNATAASPQTISIPAHDSGDLLVVTIANTESANAPNTPAGWTAGPTRTAIGIVRVSCFLKDGNGSEGSVDFTLSGDPNFGFGAVCVAFSGAKTASEAINVSDTDAQVSGVDIDAPDVTTTAADTAIIYAYVFDDDVSTEADVDSDAGFSGTLRGYEEIALPGDGLAMAVSTKTQAGAGATGTCTFSSNGDDNQAAAFTVAIKNVASFSIPPLLHSYRQRRVS